MKSRGSRVYAIGLRWVAAFTAILFLASAAVPVLAWSDTEAPPIGGELPSGGELPAQTPSSAQVIGALEAAKKREEEHEEQLASPKAVEEREASRHAYAELNASEAEELLSAKFPEALATLNSDPARSLSNVRLDRSLGEGDAVVSSEGKTQLLEGSFPVETKNEEGELEKVNVSLEKTAEGWQPKNPVVDLSVGESATEGVEVGNEGAKSGEEPVTLKQVGAEGSTARPFGSKNLFFSEVEPGSDTDMLVSPTATGVEIFDMLRSVDSPETLRFKVELPHGAKLLANTGGGAEVVSQEGSPLYEIPKPVSTDAQGTHIPTTLEVEGDTIVLHVPFRQQEADFPILVDPQVLENWSSPSWYNNQNLQGLGAWHYQVSAEGNGLHVGTEDTQWPGHGGLFIAAQPGYLAPGIWSQWIYSAPNVHSYIAKAEINPFWRGDQCSPVQNPYDYDGTYIYNENGTEVAGHWNGGPDINDAYWMGHSTYEGWGNEFVFGLGNSVGQNNACWRNLMNGGTQIWLEDWQYPTVGAPSGVPSGWVNESTHFTISVPAEDEGLGVQSVTISPEDSEPIVHHPSTGSPSETCRGTYEHPCPNQWSTAFELTAARFEQGETTEQLSAEDPTLKGSSTRKFTMKVDRTPPELSLHGQLMTAVHEAGPGEGQNKSEGGPELDQPVYSLKINATDGSLAGPLTKRSGVKKVEVLVEKAPGETLSQAYENPSCPESSCPLEATYPLKLAGFSAGKHTLEVKAYDFAGNAPKVETIYFEYEPATGISEEFILQRFPLPDGKNHENEAVNHGPELAVNVMNGNVVYHQRDVDVQGPDANLEAELFYNSQLPKEQSSEWGRGWTLSQTPRLEKTASGEGTTDKGAAFTTSAVRTAKLALPKESGQRRYSPQLHAMVSKEAGGGYAVSEQTGHEATKTLYNSAGKTTQVQTGPYAKVNYAYESGKLSEIAVSDPAATTLPPSTVKAVPPVDLTFISAFGSTGSEPGQLNGPRGVASDGKGHVWVIDQANNRVEEFSEAGEYLGQFGKKGSGNGELNGPWGITVTAAGNLWVADTGNHRVEEFNAKGEYIQKFGTKATGESKGTEFLEPEGIAAAPGGMIWVSDSGGHRVAEFREAVSSESERFVRNAGGATLLEPMSVAVDPSGDVWVADEQANHVFEFSPEGSHLQTIGTTGTGNGQLSSPTGVAVALTGYVYVVDRNNNRVEVFSSGGEYLTKFGTSGTGNGQFSEPRAIAFGASGAMFITDKGNNRVHKWGAASESPPAFLSAFGSAGSGNGQLSGPRGVAADGKGHVWVVDRANNRVEEFSESGEYLGQFGSYGSGNGQFNNPWGIAVTPAGNLWVTDTGNDRVEEFNSKGEFLQKFGTKATGESKGTELLGPEGIGVTAGGMLWVADSPGSRVAEFRETVSSESERFVRNAGGTSFKEPVGLAVDAAGNIWVTEEENGVRLLEFSPEGSFIRAVGSAGSGNGHFNYPAGVGVGPSGDVYVVDTGNNRVDVFSPTGQFLAKFGASGSGEGQFSAPRAIAFGAGGAIFVSDKGNNRIERWGGLGEGPPAFISAFGSTGSEPGQLNGPRGVAADGKGHVWVVDRANSRVEEFSEAGEYLSQFGKKGSGNGELNEPWGITVTAAGNLWVADAGNHRLEEFNAKGEYIQKFGTKATGESKGTEFIEPEGIAAAPGGMLWVSDAAGHRVAEFRESVSSESERFVLNATGATLVAPLGVAVDPSGDVWVADEEAHRVLEYSPEGSFLKSIGSKGTGNGQLEAPMGVGVGPTGNIYVVDRANNRVVVFSSAGEYLTKFGTAGSGNGQFSEPRAIAFGAGNAMFVTDKGNNRVHKWGFFGAVIPGEEETLPVGGNPAVNIHTTAGLISSVEGTQAGHHKYTHEGELLTADEGPEGTTHYQYEGSGRLSKVTLPNGTSAEVAYDSNGRATKVIVHPAGGVSKTTEFTYTEEAKTESRETIVEPEGERRTFYAISANGSVLRWWNAKTVPTFRDEAGSLWELQEKELEPGGQTLLIEGEAPEGISKIQFIANGNTVVDEQTYTGSREERKKEHLQWVTSSEDLPAGTMWIEAMITNSENESASKRWWVNVPYTPPPPAGEPTPPKFSDILHFREEMGLDLDLNPVVNELELHDRIFNLLGAWHNPQTPLGEVARASWERWGVPLRPVDVAELEYREAYLNHDIPLIEEWGRTHAPSTFAGVYVDQRAGGLMRVGFTANQATQLSALKAEVSLMAPSRLAEFSSAPAHSLASLEALAAEVQADAGLPATISSVGLDIPHNGLSVGAENVAEATAALGSAFGSQAGFTVQQESALKEAATWATVSGNVQAGDFIRSPSGSCSAGYGAFVNLAFGRRRYFLLTASHCANIGQTVWREDPSGRRDTLGEMARSGRDSSLTGFAVDVGAVSLISPAGAPQLINVGEQPSGKVRSVGQFPPVGRALLCHSGSGSYAGYCGKIVKIGRFKIPKQTREEELACFKASISGGDSGGPVWIQGTNTVVGIAVDRRGTETGSETSSETCAAPLVQVPGTSPNSAVLSNPALGALHIRTYEYEP